MSNIRLEKLIRSGKVEIRDNQCLDCYNQQVHDGIHIAITARYDDENKWVTVIEVEDETEDTTSHEAGIHRD